MLADIRRWFRDPADCPGLAAAVNGDDSAIEIILGVGNCLAPEIYGGELVFVDLRARPRSGDYRESRRALD
jgi:hypothetical protein